MTGRMSTSVPSYIPGGVNTTRCDRLPTMLLFLHSRTEVLLCCNSGLMEVEEDCQQCHCCLQATVTKNMVFVPLSSLTVCRTGSALFWQLAQHYDSRGVVVDNAPLMLMVRIVGGGKRRDVSGKRGAKTKS